MKLAFKKPISSRLSAIAGVTFVVVFLVIIINIYINKKNLALSGILNQLAFEIRLSQTMAKEVFLNNYQNSSNFDELNREIELFEEKFNALYYRHSATDFFWLDKKNAKKLFEDLRSQWQILSNSIQSYQIATASLHNNKKFLFQNNKKLLDMSDTIVKEMLQANLSQEEINTAGKQRMLSQRILYQLVVYSVNHDASVYQDFLKCFEKYNAVILSFYTRPTYKHNKSLYRAIVANYDFWQEYAMNIRQVIANQDAVFESLQRTNVYGTLLTQNLKKLYEIYEISSFKTEWVFNIFQYVAVTMVLLVIFGLFFTTFWVKKQIKNFVNYFKDMSANSTSSIQIDENTELAQAKRNIDDFIHRVQKTKESSLLAKQLGEQIHNEILEISSHIKAHLEEKNFSQEQKEEIQKQISMSEYIAIQSSDELINITRKLEKLSDSMDKSICIYNNCLLCKENNDKKPQS
ncbi:hypothetical protein [Helicobacter sp. 11S02596-1]|uniref:hypothetical protein n=1 Tax=Helicobacter sp. 11S02596-1 TaxID=1476194 RepID=UPI000BA65F4A|nr:hypothetical protein [Helicobacter sp. 11S02596-1]PAF42123.1 hypothetical protein BJI48_07385 [Helicobacter sp. 11S02596-1]